MQAGLAASVLEGVRVLEVGGEIGAWCGKMLGDMGADVIKIEPPAGDPTRGYEPFYENEPGLDRSLFFWHYNTSKRGITQDLAKDRGREVVKSLVSKADVLVDGSPARHLQSIGLGYSDIGGMSPLDSYGLADSFWPGRAVQRLCRDRPHRDGFRRARLELRIRRTTESRLCAAAAIRHITPCATTP